MTKEGVSVCSNGWREDELVYAALGTKCLVKLLCKLGPEVLVVLGIDPKLGIRAVFPKPR